MTGAAPRFAEGRLLFVRRGRLHAAPLDAATSARLTSAPVVLAQGVYSDLRSGSAHYTVSQSGLIAFVQGQEPNAQRLVEWRDRGGKTTAVPRAAGALPLAALLARRQPPRAPDRRAGPRGRLRREHGGRHAHSADVRRPVGFLARLEPRRHPHPVRVGHRPTSDVLLDSERRRLRHAAKGLRGARRRRSRSPRRGRRTARPCCSTRPHAERASTCGCWTSRAARCASSQSTPFPELDGELLAGRPLRRVLGRQPRVAARSTSGRLRTAAGIWQLSSDGGVRPVWLRTGRDRVPASRPADQRLDLRAGSHQRRVHRGGSAAGALPRPRRRRAAAPNVGRFTRRRPFRRGAADRHDGRGARRAGAPAPGLDAAAREPGLRGQSPSRRGPGARGRKLSRWPGTVALRRASCPRVAEAQAALDEGPGPRSCARRSRCSRPSSPTARSSPSCRNEERTRLLVAAGRTVHPDLQQKRRLVRSLRSAERRRAEARDRAVLAQTGIRSRPPGGGLRRAAEGARGRRAARRVREVAHAEEVLRLQGRVPPRALLLRRALPGLRRAQLREALPDGGPARHGRARHGRARQDRLPGGAQAAARRRAAWSRPRAFRTTRRAATPPSRTSPTGRTGCRSTASTCGTRRASRSSAA